MPIAVTAGNAAATRSRSPSPDRCRNAVSAGLSTASDTLAASATIIVACFMPAVSPVATRRAVTVCTANDGTVPTSSTLSSTTSCP